MSIVDDLNRAMAKAPFHQWLRCSVAGHDPVTGTVDVVVPARDEFLRGDQDDGVHGGVLAALADLAAHAVLNAHTGSHMPTIDLRVDYLRVARAPLRASATPRRVGRTIGVVDVEIRDTSTELVAIGRVVYLTATRR